MNRSIVAAALAIGLPGPATAQSIVGRTETTFSLTETVAGGHWVRLASPNGFVKVTQGTGDRVSIRADKVVRRGSVEDVGFIVRRGSDGVTVCAVFEDEDECDRDGSYRSHERHARGWSDDHQIRVNFTVSIPAGVRVKAGSGNGDVSVAGSTAEVMASSGNGRVTVEGAEGPVEASSGNGDIRVTTSLGPVEASSGNGSIDVSMDHLEGSPPMSFSTGNGRITVTVPEAFGAELESSTGNGHVTVDFPIQMRGRLDPSRIRGTIGKGGGRLVMSSGNGDLEIRKRPLHGVSIIPLPGPTSMP